MPTFYTMTTEEWMESTYLKLGARSDELMLLDRALQQYDECRGSIAHFHRLQDALDKFLVSEKVAGQPTPKIARNHKHAITKLIKQLDILEQEIEVATAKFKNPQQYLAEMLLLCDTATNHSMKAKGAAWKSAEAFDANYGPQIEFALMPIELHAVELNLLSPDLKKRVKKSIKARMLGYKYNIQHGKDAAYIEVEPSSKDQLIITVGLSGCTIVAVAVNGFLRFYHEPTRMDKKAQEKLAVYPGKVLARATTRNSGVGSAFMVCKGGKWSILIQNHKFDEGAWTKQVALDKNTDRFKGNHPVGASRSGIQSLFRELEDLKEVKVPDSSELLD